MSPLSFFFSFSSSSLCCPSAPSLGHFFSIVEETISFFLMSLTKTPASSPSFLLLRKRKTWPFLLLVAVHIQLINSTIIFSILSWNQHLRHRHFISSPCETLCIFELAPCCSARPWAAACHRLRTAAALLLQSTMLDHQQLYLSLVIAIAVTVAAASSSPVSVNHCCCIFTLARTNRTRVVQLRSLIPGHHRLAEGVVVEQLFLLPHLNSSLPWAVLSSPASFNIQVSFWFSNMILFENQLPFFVLQCLFNISSVFNGGSSLIDLALHFFSDIIPGHKTLPQEKGVDIKHLLDLLRHSYAPSWIDECKFDNDDPEILVHSATDLKIKAAIKFKMAAKSKSLLDIKFHSNGLMEIPRLKILSETESLFRNFMAFEQCCERSNAYITDYISFMGGLIKAWDDANM